jgi:aminopeptidase N
MRIVSRRLLLLALAVVVAAGAAAWIVLMRRSTVPAPAAGVPRTLAERRAARVSSLRYEATFRIPAARTEPIRASVVATFTLKGAAEPLSFDFAQPAEKLLGARANKQVLTPPHEHGHVVIPAAALVDGENVVEFDFIAGDESLNRNDEFLYALFVPARASLAMPVFDQPDLKARWRLVLHLPLDWNGVSNGRETGRARTADHQSLIFEDTQPISTYLFSFAAGRFQVETAERNGRVFRMLHRETDVEKVARNRDEIFDLHARALSWLEEYTNIPYPFGKFDFVLIPSFQFGGMEHPGAIFYNASGLLLDESATQNQRLGRASVIAHETAHMWFGDLVTMRWFSDVWMKEVFANFMAAKIVNPSFPDVNHDLRFLFAHYPSAYDVDRTEGANPIRQDLANLNEAGSLYGAIIYQKAPIVMRQLELLLGAETMRDGLREYLTTFAYGNATWPDLVKILDARTPVDLEQWSRAWVEEPGRPAIRTELSVARGRITGLALEMSDPRGRSLLWPELLTVIVGGPAGSRSFDVPLGARRTEIQDAVGLPAPRWVLPVGRGLGYGFFDLDPTTLEYLSSSLPKILDPLTRGAAMVALWEAMLEGRVRPARVVDQVLAALAVETDELLISQLLEYLRAGFWRYTAPDSRPALAERVEKTVREGLERATTTSVKAAWFNTLRSVATMPETVAWLERVWRREVTIPKLPLSEQDEAELALDLAVRDVEDADDILATQLNRLKNPDRRARFEFVMPAVSRDAGTREAFFERLRDVNNRRREAWVLEAARYLHHPMRAAASRPLVVPALELVREIQRTGDIFFPKRWADATLSGYQTALTAADVRAFIDDLPADYPPRLKWVLLSSADPLFRAAQLLQ